ncbi:hypothetical protein KJ953_02105 [Patescibacteria group bacterium]|nr:hypothetical protein [Patescibacteria group bacterium]MBU1256170.1 hypothetical protein [Patescibacteria group bacterium]MBU1457811.1 hypothetical protein [Patescibacteria group bacterium]
MEDISHLSYKDLQKKIPDGSDNPQITNLLRSKRGQANPPRPKQEKLIYPDGRVKILKPGEFKKMSPAKRREAAVGRTCSHYNSDVPGMDDID